MFLYWGDCYLKPGFVCWISEYVFFSKPILVFSIFKMDFEFKTSVKIFHFLIKHGFAEICLSYKQSMVAYCDENSFTDKSHLLSCCKFFNKKTTETWCT